MWRTGQIVILAVLLCAVGFGVFIYKVSVLEFPLTPESKYDSWYIESSFTITPAATEGNNPVSLSVKIPVGSADLAIADETFIAPNYDIRRTRDSKTGNRTVYFTRDNLARNDSILHRAVLYKLDSPASMRDTPKPEPLPEFAQYNPAARTVSLPNSDPLLVAIDGLLEDLASVGSTKKARALHAMVLAGNRDDRRWQIISRQLRLRKTPSMYAHFLLNAAQIPARITYGLRLGSEKKYARFTHWVEYYDKGRWHALDPETGAYGLQETYLPWWHGHQEDFFAFEGLKQFDYNVTVKKNTDNSLTRALWKADQTEHVWLKFSFFSLPLQTQVTMKLLLLLPVGGLIIAILRQVVGIKTFGTYMPVLIALALREAGLVQGLVLFSGIVAVGLVIRGYFDKLQLLFVPRLSSVLIIVVLLIGMMEVVAANIAPQKTAFLTLFPIIILTMSIERMSVMWEEYGAREALKTGLVSMMAALICYVAMIHPIVEHMVFVFPELHLVLLACNILLGRYNGYKLTEYYRFRALERQLAAK